MQVANGCLEGIAGGAKARSIAVIGASDQPGNLGGTAMRLLRKFGYAGRVMPVNPRRAEVGGLACFPSVADLPEPADLALITTAAPSVAGLVRDCAAAQLRVVAAEPKIICVFVTILISLPRFRLFSLNRSLNRWAISAERFSNEPYL